MTVEELEVRLDSFNAHERKEALNALCEKAKKGEIELAGAGMEVNVHCHTFFSYNCYGYSPTKFAWLARKRGLAVAGVVDFDVLDALEEFLDAAKMVGLKACGGMETRVFIPEFSEREINSPGEPGISYHMGVGFSSAKLEGEQGKFLTSLKEMAQQRNKDLTGRVNEYLKPVELDYEKDVLPLTPSGNATERHICLAYARKAGGVFENDKSLAQYWSEKLGTDAEPLGLPEGRDLLDAIRLKTMKRGGVGYVQPDAGSFPLLADTNKFVLEAGAIPTMTWLSGLSDGEQAIEELMEVEMNSGSAALNIIPDRNYTPGVEDKKLKNLYQVVELAQENHLPIVVGTEMNSPGQKFVDSFETRELAPLVPIFLKGAHIVYAHSVLQRQSGIGYTSDWVKKNFAGVSQKNEFFSRLGSELEVGKENLLADLDTEITPQQLLDKITD